MQLLTALMPNYSLFVKKNQAIEDLIQAEGKEDSHSTVTAFVPEIILLFFFCIREPTHSFKKN